MLLGLPLWWIATLALAGVLLDHWLGEPPLRWHPLVAFGRWAAALAQRCNPDAPGQPAALRRSATRTRLLGLACLLLLVGLPTLLWASLAALAQGLSQSPAPLPWIQLPAACALAAVHLLALVFALGARSLRDHVLPIGQALAGGDLAQARHLAGRIVSRELADADEAAVARAAVESTLENGNDAIFGTLAWFIVAGGPGALAFRLVNTLDALWGYRTPRWLYFGWAAARLDDVMNWLPARATALSYALLGRTRLALHCWRWQAPAWDSPNAGPVMAAGAGALGLALGGAARYQGQVEDRPPLGAGAAPGAADVLRSLALVDRALWLWLATLMACAWALNLGAGR